ncbi:hypothetical protein GQ54DRAFT_55764 [Martensiomyces pterosporus]|nr:hypothetical protein GQ54DRAFT_55764 [Martensiomyces pterosporus]
MSSPCTICNESAAKYKCPTCRAGYCSVKCFRIHKTEPCAPQLPQKSQTHSGTASQRRPEAPGSRNKVDKGSGERVDGIDSDGGDDEEEQYRLRPEDLQKLDKSVRVKELLMNPNMRMLMEAVRSDANPTEAIRVLRQRSDFEELVQALLRATEG